MSHLAEELRKIAESDELLEAARAEIEAELVQRRNDGFSLLNAGNGLAIRYADGQPSDAIRMESWVAVKIGLLAIAKRLERSEQQKS